MGGKKSKSKRPRRDGLSPEDEALWAQFAKSVRPIAKTDRVATDSAPAQAKNDSRETQFDTGAEADAGGANVGRTRQQQGKVPDVRKKAGRVGSVVGDRAKGTKTPEVAAFDDRHARRIGAGRVEIDARLDLHGMRQSEARQALRRFLFRAMAKGHRTVLVITGKGEQSLANRPWEGGVDEPRGVLKRMVPLWLKEPELAVAVVSFRTAHPRHGGEGALYVHVRRQGRA